MKRPATLLLVATHGLALNAFGVDAHHSAATVNSAAAADMTAGEVRKVDKPAGKITLKHDDIRSLDMPAMTMVFQVKDPALLDKVKQGDKVRFRAEKAGSAIVVTSIEAAQ
jgi:Cu/Ag efflux protein CusF